MSMTADGQGAIFDVPSNKVQAFMKLCGKGDDEAANSNGYLTVPSALPELKTRPGGEASAFGGAMFGPPSGGRGGFTRGSGGGRGFGGGGFCGGGRGGSGSFGRRGGGFASGGRGGRY